LISKRNELANIGIEDKMKWGIPKQVGMEEELSELNCKTFRIEEDRIINLKHFRIEEQPYFKVKFDKFLDLILKR